MLINGAKKEKVIEELNTNFRTILSYGNKGLVPMGQFIIKDIQEDDMPEEYSKKILRIKLAKVILTKVDDESVKIVLPMDTFLTQYSDVADKNSNILSIGSDLLVSLESIEKKAESKIMSDERLEELIDAETISLGENGIDYLINGEVQSSNYSICPVNISKYRERIRERIEKIDNKKKKEYDYELER